MRRGKLVEIPPEWVGRETHAQTVRKRPSKQSPKARRYDRKDGRLVTSRHVEQKRALKDQE